MLYLNKIDCFLSFIISLVMADQNRFSSKFSVGKIGTGKFYRPGSLSSRTPRGLAGALRQAKTAGKHSYAKNLSTQDLGTFQKLIGSELSKLPAHSQGLPLLARRRIMAEARKLQLAGKISEADKSDLRQIVETLKPVHQTQSTTDAKPVSQKPVERAVHFVTRDDIATQSDQVRQRHIQTGISLDLTEELASQEQGEDNIRYDLRSELGKDQAAEKKFLHPDKNNGRGKKVNLPDIKNLPDMDIG